MSERLGASWAADHDLDAAGVREVVAACLPDLASAEIRALGEGWDHRAFAVGTEILRFPKRAEVAVHMEREAGLLALLAPRLPLAVPRLVAHEGIPSAPLGFTRHARIPGLPLAGLELPRSQGCWVAARLGAFFAVLHATPLADLAGLGLPAPGWTAMSPLGRRGLARLRSIATRLERSLVTRLELAMSAAPVGGAGEPSLVHADAWPEHVLVDEASLEPTGLIDWADAEIGDPAIDLAALACIGGEETLEAGLRRYELPWDDALVARARFLAVHHAIGDAWHALQRSDPGTHRRTLGALARLFA